jgi:hypothetical protein
MKGSATPLVGDLVVSTHDEERGIECTGLVLEVKGQNCKILWHSESVPVGWWKRWQLKVISEVKPLLLPLNKDP